MAVGSKKGKAFKILHTDPFITGLRRLIYDDRIINKHLSLSRLPTQVENMAHVKDSQKVAL